MNTQTTWLNFTDRALQIVLLFLPKMLCSNSRILTNYSPIFSPLCLKSFTWSSQNLWTTQSLRQKITDVSINSSMRLYDLSITKIVWQEYKNNHSAAAEDGWMSKTTVLDQCGKPALCFFHQPSLSACVTWNTFRSCHILGKLLLQCMLDWVSLNNAGIYSTYYASIIL